MGELASLKRIFDKGSVALKTDIHTKLKPFLKFRVKPKDDWRNKAARAAKILQKKKQKKAAKIKKGKVKKVGLQTVDLSQIPTVPTDTKILLPKAWLNGIARLNELCNSVNADPPLPQRAFFELAVHQQKLREILVQNVDQMLNLKGNEGAKMDNLSKMVYRYPEGVNQTLYRAMIYKEAVLVRSTSAKRSANTKTL